MTGEQKDGAGARSKASRPWTRMRVNWKGKGMRTSGSPATLSMPEPSTAATMDRSDGTTAGAIRALVKISHFGIDSGEAQKLPVRHFLAALKIIKLVAPYSAVEQGT
jgi:hypothetical protein